MSGGAPSIPPGINDLDRLAAARFYSDTLRWAVHPLHAPDKGDEKTRGKKPLLKGWRQHVASDISPEFLVGYFGNGTNHNIGCVVRPPFIHIDLDSKRDRGKSVEAWLANVPALATVPRERTAGGVHLVFICRDLPEEILAAKKAPTANVTEAVTAELYKDGLNIVLSPSVHPSGHRYVWEVTGAIPEVRWADIARWFGFETPEPKRRGRPPKEKPWWTNWREDLRSLDLVKLLRELDRLGECVDPDEAKWSARCPWEGEHSGDKDGAGTDTVIFNKPDTLPAFRCLHSHCDARTIRDLLEWADATKPGIVSAHCGQLRVWEPGSKNREGRPRIVLPSTGRAHSEFAQDLGRLVAPSLDLFRFARNVVEITVVPAASADGAIPGHMLATIRPAGLVTAVERSVEPGILEQDDSGERIFLPKSMSEQDARITLVSEQFHGALPRIDRVLDVPVPVLYKGQLSYPQRGYDERFGTWLNPSAPEIRTMGLEEALELILGELFNTPDNGGFWWHDEQSRTHAMARFITPMCRGLMHWRRPPLFIFDGNREGCGKDTCADVTHVVYTGRSVICAPLSKDCDDEMRKRITSALMAASRFFHLANMKGHVRYASLEAATDDSGVWEDRRLGVSETLRLPNETEFSFSANNATWEPDIERRCRRIRLRFIPDNVNGHRYRHSNIRGWLLRHRSDLLSAVAALIAHWVRAGCPAGPSPFTSFPEWGRVVGGVMHACGLPDPCLPHEDSNSSGDQNTRAMRQFFALAFEHFGDRDVLKAEFQQFIQQDEAVRELFDWIDFESRRGQTVFGKLLVKFDGRELGGIALRIRQTSKNRADYRFSPIGDTVEPSPLLQPEASERGHGDVGGHQDHADIAREIISKKKEKIDALKGAYMGVGRTSPNVPVSPLPVIHTTRKGLEIVASDTADADSVAIDIETYGNRKGDGLDPWRGDIRLLTVHRAGGQIHIIDLRATGYDLGPLAGILPGKLVVGHNIKFDALWLRQKCGIGLPRVFCTLTAARLLSAGIKPGNNLDQCLQRYLGIEPSADKSTSDWGAMLLTEDQIAYAARDVAHLELLKGRLEHELEMNGLDAVAGLEMNLLPIVVEMEHAGMAVDTDRLRRIEGEARAKASTAATRVRELLGTPDLNLGSPAQLLSALQARGLRIENTTEETLQSCGEKAIVPHILEYRGLEKQAQQAASLIECIAPDGRIHGRFEPTGTATGRFSSKNPNLQNVGRGELRDCFVAPEGRVLVVADYNQVELRAAAAIAGETRMIDAYRRGDDLHRATAAAVLGKRTEEVTKEDRQMSKACFSGDTEVLAQTGWVRFDRYDGHTPVAQFILPEGVSWNPPRPRSNRWGHPTGKVHWDGIGAIEFVRPLAFKSFASRLVMAHSDRNSDLVVTPGHEIAFLTNRGNPTKRRADEVTPGNCRHFIATGFLKRTPQLGASMTRALAMVVADGSFVDGRVIRLGFTKPRKVQRCIALLMGLRVEPCVSVRGRLTSIEIRDGEFTQHILRWLTRKKDLSWDCLLGVEAATYLDEAAYWDSHIVQQDGHRRVSFCTTSEQTANVMQAMAATSGVPSTLSCARQSAEKRAPVYRLSYRLGGSSLWRASWDLKPVTTRQRVFCVQVPSGAILVRRNGKVTVQGNCNFGLLYGQSAKGLVRYAATSYGVTMSEEQADTIRRTFFRTYGHLRQWHGESHVQAEQGVLEVRTATGRRRLIPPAASEWERFTALVNTPVQGGCADGMKQAIVLVASRLPEGARIVSTVHDELIVEAEESIADQVRGVLESTMREAMADLFPQVPIEVEAKVCRSWGEK